MAATAYVMGADNFIDIAKYNATTTGNITFTTFLFLTRSLYLMGLLGRDRVSEADRAKKVS